MEDQTRIKGTRKLILGLIAVVVLGWLAHELIGAGATAQAARVAQSIMITVVGIGATYAPEYLGRLFGGGK